MFFGKGRGNGEARRRGLGATRAGVAVVFLLAMVFASGIEATGLHRHGAMGEHPNCAICRVDSSRIETPPQAAAPLARDLPRVPGDIVAVEELVVPTPPPARPRLRAPPSA
jgi:hypothetical protein